MLDSALIDVRVLPWRPRARVMRADTLRDNADPFTAFDDLQGVVVGLVLWLVILIAAPLLVLVLAVGLLSIEVPVVIGLGLLLLLIRFAGLVPWQVLVIDGLTGEERHERHRSLLRAARRVRAVNGDRRVRVRWAWC
ncbi:hypothetical protein [Nocardioides panaciterrulae]|uniref:Uncharacterized protein n=1 Tax=Nocardioides panaciterrulae TaxID=661492 RepID=A0A7Y9JBF3_9ACTN|nr:hypothetical protein [Nocardioides panaciterrulae]NYD42141.1 hypothetical protein [Nocardioides panaciterrulae]